VNNVFGTHNLAVAAAEHGVEDFVMISSDEAVRPTNVMGATKCIAELFASGAAKRRDQVRRRALRQRARIERQRHPHLQEANRGGRAGSR